MIRLSHLAPTVFLAAVLAFGGAAAATDAPPGAFQLLAQVRDDYGRLGEAGLYRDHGELEIVTAEEGASFHRHFETRTFPDGGFRWMLRTDPVGDPVRVLWRDADGTFHYDAARGEVRRASSPAAELPRFLPSGGVDALAVPALLLGVDPWLEPEGVSLDVEADAFVLHLSRMGGALATRVWIGRGPDPKVAGRILRLASDFHGPETVRVRVTYRPEPAASAADRQSDESQVVYAPPVEARRVEEWSSPSHPVYGGEAEPQLTFGDVVSVDLLTLVVRVTELGGTPIPGLGPEAFRVTVRGSEHGRVDVPITAVDWVSSELTGAEGRSDRVERIGDAGEPLPPLPSLEPEIPPPDRRVVFFVQADKNGERVGGHLRLLPRVVELAESFPSDDRLAVVGFDSHLKLWQDFTRDRNRVKEALEEAALFGGTPPPVRTSQAGPLGRALDFGAAYRAATPEKALELTGLALQSLPGEKEMIYVGWGLGRYGRGGVRMTWQYEPALQALHDAGVTVHVLDVSWADYHDLEIGLRQVARETGGAYFATFRHPEVALEGLSQTLSAYYLLRIDRQNLPDSGSIRVALAPGVRGQLLVRPLSLETSERSP